MPGGPQHPKHSLNPVKTNLGQWCGGSRYQRGSYIAAVMFSFRVFLGTLGHSRFFKIKNKKGYCDFNISPNEFQGLCFKKKRIQLHFFAELLPL